MDRARRLDLLILLVATGFFIAVAAHYYYGFYLGRPYPYNTFLFMPNDKFVSTAPGIGVHFFGDLYATWAQTRAPSAYLQPGIFFASNYLPFTHLFLKPLSWLPYPWAVVVFMVVFVGGYVTVVWRMLPFADAVRRTTAVVVLTGMTYPCLVVIDRGNVEGFVFLFLCGFVALLLVGRPKSAAVLLGLGAAFKLTPVLLVVIFVTQLRWKEIAICLLTMAIASVAGFAIMAGGILANYRGLLKSLQVYSKQSITSSPTGALQHDSSFRAMTATLAHEWSGFSFLFDAQKALSVGLLVLCVGLVLVLRLALWEQLAVLVAAMTLVPAVTGDYRLIHVMLPLLVLLRDGLPSRRATAALVLLGLILIPKGLPVLFADVSLGVIVNPMLFLLLIGVATWAQTPRWRRPVRPVT